MNTADHKGAGSPTAQSSEQLFNTFNSIVSREVAGSASGSMDMGEDGPSVLMADSLHELSHEEFLEIMAAMEQELLREEECMRWRREDDGYCQRDLDHFEMEELALAESLELEQSVNHHFHHSQHHHHQSPVTNYPPTHHHPALQQTICPVCRKNRIALALTGGSLPSLQCVCGVNVCVNAYVDSIDTVNSALGAAFEAHGASGCVYTPQFVSGDAGGSGRAEGFRVVCSRCGTNAPVLS